MSSLATVGTYLPPWGEVGRRVVGPDEDAVTLGVAAARAALDTAADTAVDTGPGHINQVVLISRDLPLLDGGNAAALLAGIGLPDTVRVVEQVGGAPAVLDAIGSAAPGTLVVAADLAPAGAGAALIGDTGPALAAVGRVVRSLPVRSRAADGVVHVYDDPRLQRERGVRVAVDRLDLPEKPVVVAGLAGKQAAGLCAGRPPALPTLGASAAIFALAALPEIGAGGLVLAVEQASATAITVDGVPPVRRDERPAADLPRLADNPGPEISISLAAYERAFEPKLRWEAGRCGECGTLAFPPRHRCLACGSEAGWSLAPLPRTGEVYSAVTVHVPVPGLPTPYSLAIVELDGT
jgi:hypothetical protein